jgi:hypothetical protein
MAGDWWNALRASWRFGGAVRLQKKGQLEAAKEAFIALDRWCDQRHEAASPPYVSVRMMVLIHLAQTASELGDHAVARAALEKWLREHGRVVGLPSLGPTDELSKWERWVRATLAPQPGPAQGSRDPRDQDPEDPDRG